LTGGGCLPIIAYKEESPTDTQRDHNGARHQLIRGEAILFTGDRGGGGQKSMSRSEGDRCKGEPCVTNSFFGAYPY